jgi:hypothetical protein
MCRKGSNIPNFKQVQADVRSRNKIHYPNYEGIHSCLPLNDRQECLCSWLQRGNLLCYDAMRRFDKGDYLHLAAALRASHRPAAGERLGKRLSPPCEFFLPPHHLKLLSYMELKKGGKFRNIKIITIYPIPVFNA